MAPNSVKDIAIRQIVVLSVTGVASIFVVIVLAITDPLGDLIIQNVSRTILLLLPLLLLILLLLSIMLGYSFYKRLQDPYLKDFTFEPKSGVSIHNKNQMYYCTNCLSKKTYMPLRTSKSHWACSNKDCPPYPNPEYTPPPKKPRTVRSKGVGFVNRW